MQDGDVYDCLQVCRIFALTGCEWYKGDGNCRAFRNEVMTKTKKSVAFCFIFEPAVGITCLKYFKKWQFIFRMPSYEVWIPNNISSQRYEKNYEKVRFSVCSSVRRIKVQFLVFYWWVAVNVRGQNKSCYILGCQKTECDKKQEFECKLFNAGTTYDSLRIQPTDKLRAGWGSSKTCKKDGNFVDHNQQSCFS